MEYIKSKDLDYNNTYFHFTRIDNRDSIEQNGLRAVAGGENPAGGDYRNPTTYFSYRVDGVLKAVDVWIKWEYYRLRFDYNFRISPTEYINKSIMEKTYEKIYEDFKNRNYYTLELIEGKNPVTSDFSFDGIDKKKEDEYRRFKDNMSKFKSGIIQCKPHYPNKDMEWMYGTYSDFSNGNIKQDNWNMNTHIGERVISSDRIKIIEAINGRTDALSIAMELYDKFRRELQDIDLSRLDDFMSYAKDRYKNDKDYEEGMPDLGRRDVNKREEKRWQRVNKIEIQKLVMQVIHELEDTRLEDETERDIEKQEKLLQQAKENQEIVGG